jgi:hypothetical protein
MIKQWRYCKVILNKFELFSQGETNMKGTTRQQGSGGSGAHAGFVSRILMVVLALVLLPAFAAGPPRSAPLMAAPSLASLQIEIWPEYDRPAALVILKGELAADTVLPAAVSLRIPASSGGPTAVASSTGPGSGLFNIKYTSKKADDFVTLTFEVPQRLFHIEFYEPLATDKPERSYTYVWPGDIAVGRLGVTLQEPAGARDISVQPALDGTTNSQDGLRYRSADLGALAAGKRLSINVRYVKSTSQTSKDILQPAAKTPPPEISNLSPLADTGSTDKYRWALILAIAAALISATGATILWWQGRKKVPDTQPAATRFCSKCGAQPDPDDRFCSKCGAPLQPPPKTRGNKKPK